MAAAMTGCPATLSKMRPPREVPKKAPRARAVKMIATLATSVSVADARNGRDGPQVAPIRPKVDKAPK